VRRWVSEQLGAALRPQRLGTVVALDPDMIVSGFEIEDIGQDYIVRLVTQWSELRRVWDREVREKPNRDGIDLVLVQCDEFTSAHDLPWDIEHEAADVVRLRWPVPVELRSVLRSSPAFDDALADAAKIHRSTVDILRHALDFEPGNTTSELGLVARLRTGPTTPVALWDVLADHLRTELAQRAARQQGDLTELQEAWADWMARGGDSPSGTYLESAPAAIATLLAAGLLTPAPKGAAGLPAWTAIGVAEPDPEDLTTELLARQPSPPTTLSDWVDVAIWWGSVRSAVCDAPSSPTAEHAWHIWEGIDEAFNSWLRASYGSQLQAAAPTPRGLHQVVHFLARRVEDGAKVVLLVIDGLGFAQWSRIRSVASLHVELITGCLAMVPTLTTVSRQAIFAGTLPVDFTDSLTTTSHEPRHWSRFWLEHGLQQRDIAYHKTIGATPDDVPELSGAAIAVVVNAVDEILHGAEVLGDPQVAASVDLWARTGFLRRIVEDATSRGYEVWITSDHGNIPTTPGPVPREGNTVEAAGTRVRTYPNPILREQAADYGVIWDPPGLARMAMNPLFAAGRRGFHTSGVRVSHGGTSLDEVIVPFVRVTA
jgi:hypothetical protein